MQLPTLGTDGAKEALTTRVPNLREDALPWTFLKSFQSPSAVLLTPAPVPSLPMVPLRFQETSQKGVSIKTTLWPPQALRTVPSATLLQSSLMTSVIPGRASDGFYPFPAKHGPFKYKHLNFILHNPYVLEIFLLCFEEKEKPANCFL
jgi:hypothetical protein